MRAEEDMCDVDPAGFRESAMMEQGRPPRRLGGRQLKGRASARGFDHRQYSVAWKTVIGDLGRQRRWRLRSRKHRRMQAVGEVEGAGDKVCVSVKAD